MRYRSSHRIHQRHECYTYAQTKSSVRQYRSLANKDYIESIVTALLSPVHHCRFIHNSDISCMISHKDTMGFDREMTFMSGLFNLFRIVIRERFSSQKQQYCQKNIRHYQGYHRRFRVRAPPHPQTKVLPPIQRFSHHPLREGGPSPTRTPPKTDRF